MNEILPDIDSELDVIFGEYRDTTAVETFVKACRAANLTGTLYIGYPVLAIDDDKSNLMQCWSLETEALSFLIFTQPQAAAWPMPIRWLSEWKNCMLLLQ